MAEIGKEFLLAEYKASMDVILNIENRRGVFLNYYAVIFVAAASISLTVLARPDVVLSVFAKLALLALFLSVAGIGVAVILVLNSERQANVRYRQRINRIRSLLCVSEDLDLTDYLSHEIHAPRGIGRTLKVVFAIISMQIVIAVLAMAVVMFHFDPSSVSEILGSS